MRRRRLLTLLALSPVLALAACGDDGTATPATEPPDGDSTPPAGDSTVPTTGSSGDYDHPTGADDVVVRIGYEGGFVTPEMSFAELPTLLVSGDGLAIQQGPQIMIYPGPFLPNLQQRTISEDGIEQLLALADEHGLLQERTYERPDNIADAPDTVVTISAGGTTYEHRAYALGLADPSGGPESDPARRQLQQFVDAAMALTTGAESDVLGPEQPYAATVYLIRATAVDDTSGYDVEPTFVEWPADTGVALADAADCAEVPAAAVQALFEQANQLTFFTDEGIDYQLAVKASLPGARTC